VIKIKAFIASLLMSLALVSPTIALADFATLSIVGNPLTAATAPYLVLNGLSGQSACTISVLAPMGGTISVEGLYNNTTNAQWTAPLTVYTPDGTVTTGTTIAAPGSYIFNCGNMSAVRADGTATTGTPTVTLNASGGINVIAKIPTPPGMGTVTAVTGSGNIASSGGTTPNITITNSPTFTGTLTAGNVIDNGLAVSSSVCTSGTSQLTTTGCATGGVTSLTRGPSANLTFTPSTGAVVGDIIENPTFTGAITDTLTSGSSSIITVSHFPFQWTTGSGNGEQQKNDNSTTVASVLDTDWGIWDFTNTTYQAAIDDSGNLGLAGSLFSAPLASSVGDCLQAGTNGQVTATASACGSGSGTVTSVTGTTNQIAVATGTTTPVLSIPSTFIAPGTIVATTSLGSTGLSANNLCFLDVAKVITSNTGTCSDTSSAGFTIPTVGSTVTVHTNNLDSFVAFTPIAITDGVTNAVSGYVTTTTSGANTFTLDVTNITAGAAGNTLASGAQIYPGGSQGTTVKGTTNEIVSTVSAGSINTLSLAANPIITGSTASTCAGYNSSQQLVSSNNCVTSVTGTANQITSSGGSTPTLSTPTTFIAPGSIASTTSITDGGIATGNCLQTSTAGLITGTGSVCGTGSGTVTSVTSANALISVATGTTTPVLTGNETPTFTGTATAANLSTSGTITDSSLTAGLCVSSSTASVLVSGIPGSGGGSCITSLAVSGTNLTTSGTTNVTLGFSSSPTFSTNVTDGGLTSGDCVQASTGGLLTSSASSCPTATAPTQQNFLTGTGTYTTPAGVKWIEIQAVGGGGGGAGSGTSGGNGGSGGNTTFGSSLIAAIGGSGGVEGTSPGGSGGTASLGSSLGLAVSGATGGGVAANFSGAGGGSCLSGGGAQITGAGANPGIAGSTNTGAGGGGATSSIGSIATNGTGGGSSGCVEAHINAPLATYAYAVGAAGTAGAAGTTGAIGGAGGSGGIWVTEHYNY
jgi:hypothetical protein